jgi:uncharacterized membrane-anchored protein YjiN (DUF445 family)
MLSDEEYKAFLTALYRRYVHLGRLNERLIRHLAFERDQAARANQIVRMLEEGPQRTRLLQALAEMLQEFECRAFIDALIESGILRAIEEDPRTFFSNLRRSVIPDEDVEILRQAGSSNPEDDLTLAINFAKSNLSEIFSDYDFIDELSELKPKMEHAGAKLEAVSDSHMAKEASSVTSPSRHYVEPKKRKILNGAGKILQGTAIGAGNVLLGTGHILPPNPAIPYGVITSVGAALGYLVQGLGDLRGE